MLARVCLCLDVAAHFPEWELWGRGGRPLWPLCPASLSAQDQGEAHRSEGTMTEFSPRTLMLPT